MGTTLTAALVIGNTAYLAHVGDSRAYLFRPGQRLVQLTRDHSTVAQLVERGVITPEEVYTHPCRNEITRCLGKRPYVEVDSALLPLATGDRLLLCSDGLWEMVRDPSIAAILSRPRGPEHLCLDLVQAALASCGSDNITALVVHYLLGHTSADGQDCGG